MSNGSERIPEHASMREKSRITNWIENVPVKATDGTIVGRARVSDRGEIQASITWEEGPGPAGFYDVLADGMYDHLSIRAQSDPVEPSYSEEVRRRFAIANEPHIKKEQEDEA